MAELLIETELWLLWV